MPSKMASTPGATAGVGSSCGRSAPNDPRHARQRLVPELVLVDQSLQRAAPTMVAELHSPEVERDARDGGEVPVLGTNSNVASGSMKRRMAQAVAMRSMWMRSRVTRCTNGPSTRSAIRHRGQLRADALPKGEALVDRLRGLSSATGAEVVSIPDLSESALQGDQLLLRSEPLGKVPFKAGRLKRSSRHTSGRRRQA
jgi:hypothetical protein